MTIAEDRKETQVYELGYLILPSIPEEGLSDVVARLKKIIKDNGGVEIGSEDPFKMDLTYTMSKVISSRKYVVKDAYIGWVKFDLEPEAAPIVNEAVKAVDEVLRFLLIKAPRATTFTFESARKALEEEEKAKHEAESEASEKAEAAPEASSETVVE